MSRTLSVCVQMCQGGDVTHYDGRGGESLHNFGAAFADETYDNPHYGPGAALLHSVSCNLIVIFRCPWHGKCREKRHK